MNKLPRENFDPEQALLTGARRVFGEFGGVNQSIHPSTTFTTMDPEIMSSMFNGSLSQKGCHLYGRHFHPNSLQLGAQVAAMENTQAAYPVASGMAAISTVLNQVLEPGSHIIASQDVYGGTYAYLNNVLRAKEIEVSFVDPCDPESIAAEVAENTKAIFVELMSNPLLKICDLEAISQIAGDDIQLIVDNTFAPLTFTPANLGADIVIYSGTKFLNGMSDFVSGIICCSSDFLTDLMDLQSGQLMLGGPVLDPKSCFQLQLYLQTLPTRIREHSYRSLIIAGELASKKRFKIIHPGLESSEDFTPAHRQCNKSFAMGGMMAIDLETYENARRFIMALQDSGWAFNAVSLGYFHSLVSISGSSTSSEIDMETQATANLSPGLVRVSVGFMGNIDRQIEGFEQALAAI